MNGSEHYGAAESDLEAGDNCFEHARESAGLHYQSAQVRATLALVDAVRDLIEAVRLVHGAMP